MCTWTASTEGTFAGRRREGKRRFHYIWELDDGRPGFVRQTKRDRLRLYWDSDADGEFTNEDVLIGRARIKKHFRGREPGALLQDGDFGLITAFNALNASTADLHGELSSDVGLTFGHPEGGEAAVFHQVFLPYLT